MRDSIAAMVHYRVTSRSLGDYVYKNDYIGIL